MELHSIVQLTEERQFELIERTPAEGVDGNPLMALLQAVTGSARMVLTVRYTLVAGSKRDRQPDSLFCVSRR